VAAITRTVHDAPGAGRRPRQVPESGRATAGQHLFRSAVAFAALAAVAAHAENGGLWPLDQAAIRAVQSRRRPAAVSAAHTVSALAEPAFAFAVLAAFTVLVARRAGWRAACLPGLTVAGGAVARRRLSQVIARPRPPAAVWLAEPEGFSLPSKHTTLAALTAGACASSAGVRGAPRLLVVHWPTDVLAAWLFAEGWLGLAEAVAPAFGPDRAGQPAIPGIRDPRGGAAHGCA
jgi:membrane-associated phospholipid phosphatase